MSGVTPGAEHLPGGSCHSAITLTDKQGLPYVLRLLETSDTEALERFFRSLSREAKRMFRPYPFTVEMAGKLARAIDPRKRLILVSTTILGDTETIVGYAFVNIAPFGGRDGALGIALLDDHTGRGLGSALLDHLLRLVADRKCGKVWLTAFEQNDRARRLYQRAGFVEVESRCSLALLALRLREGLFVYGPRLPVAYVRAVKEKDPALGREVHMVRALKGPYG
ncbi:GNAT family N-acetyltransferase [Chloroflexota bacterium]